MEARSSALCEGSKIKGLVINIRLLASAIFTSNCWKEINNVYFLKMSNYKEKTHRSIFQEAYYDP